MAKGSSEAAQLLVGLMKPHCVSVEVTGALRLGVPEEEVQTIEVVGLAHPPIWESLDEEDWTGTKEDKPDYVVELLADNGITGKGSYLTGRIESHAAVVHLVGGVSSYVCTKMLSTGPDSLILYQKGFASSHGFCLHHTGLYLNAEPPQSSLKWWRLSTPNEENVYSMLGLDYAAPKDRAEAGKFVLENLGEHQINQCTIVSKSDRSKKYTVTNAGGVHGHWECDCPDWMYRRSTHIPPEACKHIGEAMFQA